MSSNPTPKLSEEAFEDKIYPERTYAIKVGCGTLLIIFEREKDGRFHKIRIPRMKDFNCAVTARDALARDATYKMRRDPKQLIKDLKGSKAHHCEHYNITCKAYSCEDAMARVIEREISQ